MLPWSLQTQEEINGNIITFTFWRITAPSVLINTNKPTLSNKRIFPAVDVTLSSTRRDDLLYSPALANRIWIMRKFLADMNCIEAMELLQDRMQKYGTNDSLLQNMDKDDM